MAITYEELVLRLVEGRVFVTIREMATITGFPEQSIRNWRCAGKWPIESEKRGGKVYTSTPVFIQALESGILWALHGKRGRPRKNAVTDIAAARAASAKRIVKRLSEQGNHVGHASSFVGSVSMDEASRLWRIGGGRPAALPTIRAIQADYAAGTPSSGPPSVSTTAASVRSRR